MQQNRLENLQKLVWACRKHSGIFFPSQLRGNLRLSRHRTTHNRGHNELTLPFPPLSQQQTHRLANFPYNVVRRSGTKTWRYRKPTCHNCILGWKSGSLPQNIGPFVGDWKMCVSVDGGSNRSSTTWPLPWLSCLTIL